MLRSHSDKFFWQVPVPKPAKKVGLLLLPSTGELENACNLYARIPKWSSGNLVMPGDGAATVYDDIRRQVFSSNAGQIARQQASCAFYIIEIETRLLLVY